MNALKTGGVSSFAAPPKRTKKRTATVESSDEESDTEGEQEDASETDTDVCNLSESFFPQMFPPLQPRLLLWRAFRVLPPKIVTSVFECLKLLDMRSCADSEISQTDTEDEGK